MNQQKDSDLNNAILRYICECENTGDFQTLNKLEIEPKVLEMLRSMTINEVLHTSHIRSSFIKSLKIDSKILSNLLSRAQSESSTRKLTKELIVHGAPLKLVYDLTGIGGTEFSARRQMLKVVYRGRTNIPTPEQEALIFEAWKKLGLRAVLTGDEWVMISKQINLPIRLIYKVICGDEATTNDKLN